MRNHNPERVAAPTLMRTARTLRSCAIEHGQPTRLHDDDAGRTSRNGLACQIGGKAGAKHSPLIITVRNVLPVRLCGVLPRSPLPGSLLSQGDRGRLPGWTVRRRSRYLPITGQRGRRAAAARGRRCTRYYSIITRYFARNPSGRRTRPRSLNSKRKPKKPRAFSEGMNDRDYSDGKPHIQSALAETIPKGNLRRTKE